MAVSSLLAISSAFVIDNISVLESLVGFPDSLGEPLFARFCEKWNDDGSSRSKLAHGLSVFGEAYGPMLLASLNLASKLVTINEYTECLLPILVHVTALDLSHCQLGRNHEFWTHFSRMTELTDLRLRDCAMTDDIVRALTIPCRVNATGFIKLAKLDISCNPMLTKSCLCHLKTLRHLDVLHLSGTDIPPGEALRFGSNVGMRLSTENGNATHTLDLIFTMGWAEPLVQRWIDCGKSFNSPRKDKLNSPGYCKFYALTRPANRVKMAEELKMSPPPKTLPKMCLVRYRPHPGPTERNQKQMKDINCAVDGVENTMVVHDEIDEDLMNGYLSTVPALSRPRHKRNLLEMLNG